MSEQLEQLILDMGDPARGALRRAKARVAEHDPALYADLLAWAGRLAVTRAHSKQTFARYVDAFVAFVGWLRKNGEAVDQVDGQTVDRWMRDLMIQDRLAKATRGLRLTGVRSFYAWWADERDRPNPLSGVIGPGRQERAPRRFSRKEIHAMWQAVQTPAQRLRHGFAEAKMKRDSALLLFFLSTGARREEAATLRLDQLEVRSRSARVMFEGKGAKERVVSFEGEGVIMLLDWMNVRQHFPLSDPERLWCTISNAQYGNPISVHGLESWFNTLQRRAKCRRHRRGLHTLRITYATELYDQGADIETIRRLLGHESIETTRRYLAVSDRMQRTRLSSRSIREITGIEPDMPMWLKDKLEKRNGGS